MRRRGERRWREGEREKEREGGEGNGEKKRGGKRRSEEPRYFISQVSAPTDCNTAHMSDIV